MDILGKDIRTPASGVAGVGDSAGVYATGRHASVNERVKRRDLTRFLTVAFPFVANRRKFLRQHFAFIIIDPGFNEFLTLVIKLINSLQFLLASSIYIGILHFVNPTGEIKIRYWLHFLPFFIFAGVENVVFSAEKSINTKLFLKLVRLR